MKRGRSSAFLRNLRRKYGLGEFKRKGKTSNVQPKKKASRGGPQDGFPYTAKSVKDPQVNKYLSLDLSELRSIDPDYEPVGDAQANADALRVAVPWKDGSTNRERFNREAYLWAVLQAQKREGLATQAKGAGKLPTGEYQWSDEEPRTKHSLYADY